jgi:hypothetical protein
MNVTGAPPLMEHLAHLEGLTVLTARRLSGTVP